MKVFGLLAVILCGSLLLYSTGDFPDWGDKDSPANTYLSPHYITKSLEETAVPNMVTAVLADYRGYDTMFETTVIFSAGLACFFLLRISNKKEKKRTFYRHIATGIILHIKEGGKIPEDTSKFTQIDSQWTPNDLIIKVTCRMIIPFIQLFGLYVIAHGHHSPGGGFQGGVILGASMILFAISHDLRTTRKRISEKTAAILSTTGVLIYAGTGLLCMLFGAVFLDYSALAWLLGSDPIMARSHGMLMVEIGVGMAVMFVMIWIYYNISSAGKQEEGL